MKAPRDDGLTDYRTLIQDLLQVNHAQRKALVRIRGETTPGSNIDVLAKGALDRIALAPALDGIDETLKVAQDRIASLTEARDELLGNLFRMAELARDCLPAAVAAARGLARASANPSNDAVERLVKRARDLGVIPAESDPQDPEGYGE